MSGEIVEEAFVVCALPIFKTFELNLSGLLFFGFIDLLTGLGNADSQMIENIELKPPHNVSGVLNVARFFETFEGNRIRVILPVKAADDDKSRVGFALEFFELANGVINAELCGFFGTWNDLEVVEADDRRMSSVGTKRPENLKQVVDSLVFKFQNAQIDRVGRKVVYDVLKLNRPRATPDVRGGQVGLGNAFKKFARDGFGKQFKLTHFVGAVDASLAFARELFEQLPAKSRFAGGGSRADDVKPRMESLKFVEIFKAGFAVDVIFDFVYLFLKNVGEEIVEGSFFFKRGFAAEFIESLMSLNA